MEAHSTRMASFFGVMCYTEYGGLNIFHKCAVLYYKTDAGFREEIRYVSSLLNRKIKKNIGTNP